MLDDPKSDAPRSPRDPLGRAAESETVGSATEGSPSDQMAGREMVARSDTSPTRRDAKGGPEEGGKVFIPPLPGLRTDNWPTGQFQKTLPDKAKFPDLPPMPEPVETRDWFAIISFLIMVALPTLCAAIYLFVFVSSQYVSEFRFSVMQSVYSPLAASTNGAGSATLNSSATSAISMLTGMSGASGGGGIGAASSQNYIVVDFLKTRRAVDQLQSKIDITSLYSKGSIDPLSRFNKNKSMEDFVNYWGKMIYADYDMVTGIATVRVKAYTPQDALKIANTMVGMSEGVINEINDRAEKDAVREADAEVQRARVNLAAVRAKLNKFRSSANTIDPTLGSIPINNAMAQQLLQQLASLRAQLDSLKGQGLNANSPTASYIRSEIAATEAQYQKVEAQISRQPGAGGTLTNVVNDFESITIESNYAQAALVTALQAADQARANANAIHFFLTPYATPSLPQSSTAPNRWVLLLMISAGAVGVWLIVLMVVRSVRDHEL